MSLYQLKKVAVKKYQWAMNVANAIMSLPQKLTPAPFRLLQIGSMYWQSRALYTAAQLNIAEALADRQLSTVDLAQDLQLHEDHLYRLMRMLASIGVFKEVRHRIFENSKSSHYLSEHHPDNVKAMVVMHNCATMTAPWQEVLEQSIRVGDVPFQQVHGSDMFDYMDDNTEFDQLFSRAMDSVENLIGDGFGEEFNWLAFDRLVDIGGSKGSKAIAVLNRHPTMRALIVDRPQIIEQARGYWQGKIEPGVVQRLDFCGGDILVEVPSAQGPGDLFLCSAVFHALGDADCVQLLQNLRRAIADSGATLVIADAVAEEVNIDPMIASFDMQMLIGTRGRERTLREWNTLFDNSGFALRERVKTQSLFNFLVLTVN